MTNQLIQSLKRKKNNFIIYVLQQQKTVLGN